MPTRISKVHASWRLKQTRNFKDFLQTLHESCFFWFWRDTDPENNFFWGQVISIFTPSSHWELFISVCCQTTYQTDVMNNIFLCQHFTKRIQSSADGTSRLVTSSLTCLWAFSCASVLTHQSTCGKSNQFTNLQTHSGLEGILSNYMYLSVQEEGFLVWTSLLLFTVCQTPSVNFDMFNLGPTVTHIKIGPIVRRVPPIRNDHVYPCDSDRYQNELLCTNLLMEYTGTTGLDDVLASCNAG